jgi:hypothetical protein
MERLFNKNIDPDFKGLLAWIHVSRGWSSCGCMQTVIRYEDGDNE